MGALHFDVNNNGVLKVSQNCPDSKVEVTTTLLVLGILSCC